MHKTPYGQGQRIHATGCERAIAVSFWHGFTTVEVRCRVQILTNVFTKARKAQATRVYLVHSHLPFVTKTIHGIRTLVSTGAN